MSPRKRTKPNPSGLSGGSTTSLPATLPSQPSTGRSLATASGELSTKDQKQRSALSSSQQSSDSNGSQVPSKQVRKSGSWYGSLGRKASASTQVAKETIMGGTVRSKTTVDLSRFEPKRNAEDLADSDAQSTRTMPKIHENDGPSAPDTATESAQATSKDSEPTKELQNKLKLGEEADTDMTEPEQPKVSNTPGAAQSTTSSGWFGGWFGAPTAPIDNTSNEHAPLTDVPRSPEPVQAQPPVETSSEGPPTAVPETPTSGRPTSSWLGYWWNTTAESETPQKDSNHKPNTETVQAKEDEDVVMKDAPPPPASVESQPSAGSTWAFWSRDTGSKDQGGQVKATQEPGELAVIGEGSEANPQQSTGVKVKDGAASMKEAHLNKSAKEIPVNKTIKETPISKTTKGSPTKSATLKASKRGRPQSVDLDEPTLSRPDTPVNKAAGAKLDSPTSVKASPPNLLLPSFRSTYQMKQNPSIIKQITRLLLRTQQPSATHVYLAKEPPRIKKAIAIGVHGLFPAIYLRPMIGQPTGTSIRFANHCADAIRRWADNHGCEDCEIEKVALEGEGKIADRVDNLWKLLLNWIDHIRSADLILVGCHSQGVPVGLMLVAKLIDLGVITNARIGICAMAGVSLGPFPDYKSGMGMLMGSVAELWQFADPSSEIAQRLEHAVKTVLEHGCRVTFIGSIDDQVVPMESAVYSPAAHPYIYRAVFVDGRIHAPDFIAHLVGFALKLRNLGVSDQGLIRELSVALAGSLYSGEGHSRLYDDEQVYDLAVSHALETTDVGTVPSRVDKHEGMSSSNPYILPWIMRGLLEEGIVKTELSAETAELLQQFDDWKPVTKALKDIKFRLEAVRSRL
ncbi:hypothetical protein PFICI_12597 [Pestalotiopsis fici W106-1]|uniref:YMC020W-like alpha/beta hydrolase domain-containing protein n=1 Tax=Pestalotiopsis fici (strain W106-1 / CGMCC3.15140) TaxID=1229662 RepID=W3WP65_PESFW|nr:uncharacterized protein PFICI_12597 [Pestalotiopsis fici W106-1]ETS75653.1 hypothetical protein PFICI_12597 [Pestalotiopsis fici W106-1]